MASDQLPNLGGHGDGGLFDDAALDADKAAIFRTAAGLLDRSLNGIVEVTVSAGAGAAIALAADDFLGAGLVRLVPEAGSPGGPAAPFEVVVAPGDRGFAVQNLTGETCTVAQAGSPAQGVAVESGRTAWLHSAGGLAVARLGEGNPRATLAFSAFVAGMPPTGSLLAMLLAARGAVLAAGAPGAVAHAATPPGSGADYVIAIVKNDVGVGTVTFESASNTGVISVTADVALAPLDRLKLVAPAPSPAEASDIADIAITIPLSVAV